MHTTQIPSFTFILACKPGPNLASNIRFLVSSLTFSWPPTKTTSPWSPHRTLRTSLPHPTNNTTPHAPLHHESHATARPPSSCVVDSRHCPNHIVRCWGFPFLNFTKNLQVLSNWLLPKPKQPQFYQLQRLHRRTVPKPKQPIVLQVLPARVIPKHSSLYSILPTMYSRPIPKFERSSVMQNLYPRNIPKHLSSNVLQNI